MDLVSAEAGGPVVYQKPLSFYCTYMYDFFLCTITSFCSVFRCRLDNLRCAGVSAGPENAAKYSAGNEGQRFVAFSLNPMRFGDRAHPPLEGYLPRTRMLIMLGRSRDCRKLYFGLGEKIHNSSYCLFG